MSKTDNTRSFASWKRELGDQWSWRYFNHWEWIPPTPREHSRTKARFVRRYWHSERFRTRLALMNYEPWFDNTPEPSRPRRQADWDLW